jgi:copper(I)-binding protein
MAMTTRGWLWMVLMAGLLACGKVEHQQKVGGLEVARPWSRALPPNAPVAAGFLSIRNRGEADDRLIAVHSDAAERVEIHEVRHEDGIARMRELPDGLALPAGATVELKPGGYHLMFITPRSGFVAGNHVKATLMFAGAGELDVEFEVQPMSATGPQADSHH